MATRVLISVKMIPPPAVRPTFSDVVSSSVEGGIV